MVSIYQIHEILSRLDPHLRGAINSPSDILGFLPMRDAEISEACSACETIVALYRRLSTALGPPSLDLIEALGVLPHVAPLVRNQVADDGSDAIVRFDLIRTRDGYKIIELNSDGIGLIVAAFALSPLLCEKTGLPDIDFGAQAALERLIAAGYCRGRSRVAKRTPELVFSARGRDGGNAAVAHFLKTFASRLGIPSRFVPTESLRIARNHLADNHGRRVFVIYRIEPLDSFVGAFLPDHPFVSGIALAGLVERRRVAFANSSVCHLWHSKAFQCLIWRLYEQEIWLSQSERAAVRRWMLPSYLNPVFTSGSYVTKPAYGKQGDTVAIVDAMTLVTVSNGTTSYANQRIIYQEHASSSPIRVTERGLEHWLYIVLSVFVVGGRAVRLIARAGKGITDNTWWVLPVTRQSS